MLSVIGEPKPLERRTLAEFLAHPYPEPTKIIDPWLPTAGLVMLYGPTGNGKTFVSLGLAMSVAAGWPVLDYSVRKPWRVLYVDGEMNPGEVKQRIGKLQAAHCFPPHTFQNFHMLSHADAGERGLSGIDEQDPLRPSKARRIIERNAEDVDLIILDNLSSLCNTGPENNAECWNSISEWLLGFRRKQKTVLLIDHAGKPLTKGKKSGFKEYAFGGRGTSKKTDLLNAVIQLVGQVHEADKYLECQWTFEKHRGFFPKGGPVFTLQVRFNPEDTEAKLMRPGSALSEIEELIAERARAGQSIRSIAAETGIDRNKVHRALKKHETRGGQPDPGSNA